MRLFSTAALSLALVAATGLTLPGAALAQNKKEDEKAAANAGLQASRNFFKIAKPLQDLLAAKDFPAALAMMPDAEAQATTPDDRYFIGNFYLSIGLGTQDLAMQRKGIEGMLASGKVAPAELARVHTAAGSVVATLKDMPAARTHLQAALAAGASAGDIETMIAETYFGEAYAQVQGDTFTEAGRANALAGLPHLRRAIDARLAAGSPPPLSWYERGMQTAVIAQSPDAFEWAKLTLAQTDKANDWNIAARVLQDTHRDMPRSVNLDLLRLMHTAKAMKNPALYAEFLQALTDSGLPGEVAAVIASGSQTGEFTPDRFADFSRAAQESMVKDRPSLAATATNAASSATGRMASRTADAYQAYGEYDKAIPLYRMALEKGGVDVDEVNTRLGIALYRSGDLAGARTAFDAVSGAGPRRQIADLWALWLTQQGRTAA